MNKDISVMLESQKLWLKALHCAEEVEKAKKVILSLRKEKADLKALLESKGDALKQEKLELNKMNLSLAEKESQFKKLSDKKYEVSSEKEFKALESEISKIESDKGSLEESILSGMDRISELEIALKKFSDDLAAKESEINEKNKTFEERIQRFFSLNDDAKKQYAEKVGELSPIHRSRFEKLVTSQDGLGIVPAEGDNCSRCHFKIPSDFKSKLSKDEVVICPNCGRFLYIA